VAARPAPAPRRPASARMSWALAPLAVDSQRPMSSAPGARPALVRRLPLRPCPLARVGRSVAQPARLETASAIH
jgi:hypothetical protein